MSTCKTIATALLALLALAQAPATQPAAKNAPAPAPAPAPSAPSAAANADITAVIREGSYLVDQSGRLRQTSDGQQWEFRLDAGAPGQQGGSVLILPNLNLMLMESAVNANSRELRFKITGMVTEYRGRNYVLLQKVLVVPDPAR